MLSRLCTLWVCAFMVAGKTHNRAAEYCHTELDDIFESPVMCASPHTVIQTGPVFARCWKSTVLTGLLRGKRVGVGLQAIAWLPLRGQRGCKYLTCSYFPCLDNRSL